MIWAATGTFAAITTLVIGLQSFWIGRVIDARIEGLRNEMLARFDALERDLQRLYERVFHEGEGRS